MTLTTKTLQLKSTGLTFTAYTAGEGPVVFLLHGFPDHAGTFEQQFEPLVNAGFRVIAPMLRGYEPSSQPATKQYHVLDMTQDLINWLDQLGLEQVHVIGHDWGAIIGQAAVLTAPDRFISLTILAVPHVGRMRSDGMKSLQQLRNSWYSLFFQLRLISDYVVRRNNFKFLEYLWRYWSPDWHWSPQQMDELKRVFSQPGVCQGALCYYRQLLVDFSGKSRRMYTLFEQPFQVPVLALSGKLDGCIDNNVFTDSIHPEDFSKGLQVETVDDAGHFLHQERPDQINRLILEWLSSH